MANTQQLDSATQIRAATLNDLDRLVDLERACFAIDRLSKRSFRHHIQNEHGDLLLAESTDGSDELFGYGLVLRHRGTRLARLYSLAVDPRAQGQGLAKALLAALEQQSAAQGRLFMRLEVAKSNRPAIALYERLGYRVFGEYVDYYEDHSDALRMQKKIRVLQNSGFNRHTPWYQQTTDFTCGPASLMMAMASLNSELPTNQQEEIDIWRQATTVFMTSGHGGCHPFGLALAAKQRGFNAQVYVNTVNPLFTEGVRSDQKKQVMTMVHRQFEARCQNQAVSIVHDDITPQQVESWLYRGDAVLVLISTYRFDGRKAPHWVVVTGVDDECFYIHDPDLDPDSQQAIDCQYLPIAKDDFAKMSAFGAQRLRTAVSITTA